MFFCPQLNFGKHHLSTCLLPLGKCFKCLFLSPNCTFCFHSQCTCKLGTLNLFETCSAFGCFENADKGSYCGNSFNQDCTAQLTFILMTLLCICSIDLLSTKLKKKNTTACQVVPNVAPTITVKLCGDVSSCSIR